MCFQWPFNSHSILIRYILQSINIFVFKCKRRVNHSGGMLISPDSCDNQKLWCKSRLYPAILSAEIISFTRDASSFYPSAVPPSLCPLGVSLISSLFFQHGHGREGWVLCTYCRGVCILAGLSILFLLSPPPAPVSSCAARTLPLASRLPPLFDPSYGHPAYSRTSHCSSQEMVPGACHNQQPCPAMNQVLMTIHRQGCLPGGRSFMISFQLACLVLPTQGSK